MKYILFIFVVVQISINSGELKKYIQLSDAEHKNQFKVLKVER